MTPSILVLGAGSIGTRHIKNLLALGADVAVTSPDAARSEATGARVIAFDRWTAERPDGILVASPTVFHVEQGLEALDMGAKALVEKPLALSVADADRLAAVAGDRVAVAFNLRLHAPIAEIIGMAHAGSLGRLIAVRVWYGQHLATWRPGTDYRVGYSAQTAMGGGIINDAAHELDLLVWLLGSDLEVVGSVVTRTGELDADIADLVRAVVRSEDVIAEIALDAVSRRYRRGIEIIGSDATARFDWARSVIEVETTDDLDARPVTEHVGRSYEIQAARFLQWIADGEPMPVDARTGAASVRLASAIRDVG
jgi:predicted dehydrogenase